MCFGPYPKNLEQITTSIIYKGRAADVIPSPKVESKYPAVDFKNLVYPCLGYTILEAEPKDILYSIVHRIQPTRQRLFEQGRVQDASCQIPQCQGMNKTLNTSSAHVHL